ncbi:MAG: hypothetical protein Q7J44_15675 [Pseudotabrizicola sp.]|uniref:hypothetical protein n=1 Tax=Pseudotabrizicola sp. TaxID=2939647 RepID=UPI002727D530|nr:hypothetical protein [Pseudotabrizicola sp.]MDO9639976.1 hypothetical protein [Pseudotabrizicola sp.]
MSFSSADFTGHFDELMKSISESKVGGYPLSYQRVDQKTEPVIRKLELFRNRNVLEIGSNFGMYTMLTSQFAKTVTGLEIDRSIFDISGRWLQFFKDKGYSFDNITLLNESAATCTRIDYDALLLTLVLYHLSDDEIDLIIEDAKKKCDCVVIQCRPGRILAAERGSFSGHISKNTRFDGVFDIAGNIRFLEALGMKKISVAVSEKMLGSEVFPVLTGER